MKLVFIHGRSQEHKDPVGLKATWISALNSGLRASGLTLPIPEADIVLPYYGDKLFSLSENLDNIEHDMVAKGAAPVSEPMLAFEAQALSEIATKAGITETDIAAQADTNITEKGPQNWPWVLAIVRAIDHWNGGLSAQAIRLIMRDVYVYTTRGGIEADVNDIINAALTEEPTVIVSHSLGTVVAYNVLRRATNLPAIPLLVTLGSPLGINAVRRQLVPLKPPKVSSWFNAFDPRDIVALNPLDANNFAITPPVENKGDVDNFTDNRHSIAGYLSDPVVALRVHNALTSAQAAHA